MAKEQNKRDVRRSVRQSGWITLDGGFAARPCEVVDLSKTGAKLTMENAISLGPKLRLAFSRDSRTGRNCEVIWRRGTTVGVKFVG
ncbi:PilZ domain-containing protein [Rhodopseudomonas sp. HC1]|uniref:PilZ domain-containing protein n=1 Tax=Rhodopseudomonas infernalis TaxID=2897386 RepID=UPI001EE852DD|nr:PilZ domain-containing protein [Rhodopseudomonas infernalis]MCG6203601.1 PilZ domain-containing protein [Rhodopseudomonas infernalis]